MGLKKITLFLFLSLVVLSCKDSATTKDEQVQKTEQKKEVFTVVLTAVVKKNDSFQIFYKDDEGAAFEEKNSFFVEFKGSDSPQDIVFNLPEDVVPNYLRIDFGVNKEQSPIEIKNFKMSYFGKSFEAKGKDFFEYFYGNDATEKVDKVNAIVTPIVAEGVTYDPMFSSAEGLRKQIEIITR